MTKFINSLQNEYGGTSYENVIKESVNTINIVNNTNCNNIVVLLTDNNPNLGIKSANKYLAEFDTPKNISELIKDINAYKNSLKDKNKNINFRIYTVTTDPNNT